MLYLYHQQRGKQKQPGEPKAPDTMSHIPCDRVRKKKTGKVRKMIMGLPENLSNDRKEEHYGRKSVTESYPEAERAGGAAEGPGGRGREDQAGDQGRHGGKAGRGNAGWFLRYPVEDHIQ